MAAIFVRPLSFAASSTSTTPTAGTIASLNNDEPGMAVRLPLSASIIIDLGPNPVSYDYVSVIGNNLRPVDTIQISTGTSNTGTGSYGGGALAAWTGVKNESATVTSIYKLNSVRTERYIRIFVSAQLVQDANGNTTRTAHPDGYVQCWRVCVGKSISTIGVAFDAEQGYRDNSIRVEGPDYTSIDEYSRFQTYKFSIGMITDQSWRGEWQPFLQAVGQSRAFLFVPDDATPANYQVDAIYGRLVTTASGKAETYNGWRFEASMIAVSI